jgi:phosphatidylserine decarboxylase
MKHAGKARKAAFRIMLLSLIAVGVVLAIGILAILVGSSVVGLFGVLVVVWLLFCPFTLYFFRDPNPRVPAGTKLVVSPAHGKIDVIDTVAEPQFMGGDCQRISIFLSIFNVHIQYAPVGGKLAFFKYTMGQFINALKAESALHNENVLFGFEPSEVPGQKLGVRLIAGVLARRIVPYAQLGDEAARGERISLIQFGSRVDVYLPAGAKIKAKVGDRVVGGETVLATFD